MFKITDGRSIVKQIVSGICWSPIIIFSIAAGIFVIGVIIIVVFGMVTSGWENFLKGLLQIVILYAILGLWLFGFAWSKKK